MLNWYEYGPPRSTISVPILASTNIQINDDLSVPKNYCWEHLHLVHHYFSYPILTFYSDSYNQIHFDNIYLYLMPISWWIQPVKLSIYFPPTKLFRSIDPKYFTSFLAEHNVFPYKNHQIDYSFSFIFYSSPFPIKVELCHGLLYSLTFTRLDKIVDRSNRSVVCWLCCFHLCRQQRQKIINNNLNINSAKLNSVKLFVLKIKCSNK